MRKPFMAGNWKMNLLSGEGAALAKKVVEAAKGREVEVGIAPAFTAIAAVGAALTGSGVRLMAQNIHWEDKGAFTGEVSAPMVKDLGCTHVIIGHSERRQFFGETDETVNRRLQAAFHHGLTPIVCIGETLSEREGGKTLAVLEKQVKGGLAGIGKAQARTLVIAYEPVWAIGTGKTATTAQAQEAHAFIRKLLAGLYDQDCADAVRIQYGGSVKPDNVRELMGMPDIDGALVGGASLKAESFIPIIRFND
jgi:triosephosphate isomerase